MHSIMRALASIRSLLLPLLAVAAGALPVRAGSNLLENSPFLPPNTSAGAAQEASPLELRSILRAGGDFEFSLYDPAKKLSTWARLNESGHDFVVKAYDPEKEIVTVERRSRTYKLALKEAKIVPLIVVPGQAPGMAGMPPAGMAPGSGPMGPGAPGQMGPMQIGGRGPVGPTPSLTPEQLRSLETDINRRRELRRQAAAPPGSMPQAQPSTPPQQR
jgi:hypothetical protein